MNDHTANVDPAPPLSVRVAGFWRRSAAFLVDFALVSVASLAVASAFGLIDWAAWPEARWNALDQLVEIVNAELHSLVALGCCAAVIGLVYGAATEATLGASVGKRVVRICVVDHFGEPVGPARAALRNVLKVISLAALGLGALWCAVDLRRRALHDIGSRTLVVERSFLLERHQRGRKRPVEQQELPQVAAWE
jgi:uncharacterized RDD family membrane protein YckC